MAEHCHRIEPAPGGAIHHVGRPITPDDLEEVTALAHVVHRQRVEAHQDATWAQLFDGDDLAGLAAREDAAAPAEPAQERPVDPDPTGHTSGGAETRTGGPGWDREHVETIADDMEADQLRAHLAAVRIVARHWHASAIERGWVTGGHALGIVLAALDGQTNPRELGIPDDHPDAAELQAYRMYRTQAAINAMHAKLERISREGP